MLTRSAGHCNATFFLAGEGQAQFTIFREQAEFRGESGLLYLRGREGHERHQRHAYCPIDHVPVFVKLRDRHSHHSRHEDFRAVPLRGFREIPIKQLSILVAYPIRGIGNRAMHRFYK